MAELPDHARHGIQSDLAQMDAIIGQFLDYAKPTDAATFTRIDISALLADCGHEAARLPDVRIKTAIDEKIAVLGNPIDMRRVINNLIENARRYGKTDGGDVTEIDIVCHVGSDLARIEVADHGVGVPESEMERLVRPFTRMDIARGQANGAGLGLAIVERIIKRHGGKLRLYNRTGGGLAIEITLPVAGTGDQESGIKGKTRSGSILPQ
jgi:two-component system osmolarity sensor histidine kinase EnvZ